MKKAILKTLSVALAFLLCFSISIFASAESAWYYADIDFSESAYADGHLSSATVVDDSEASHGKSLQITSIRSNGQRSRSSAFRIIDESGTASTSLNGALCATPQRYYRLTFDIKVVSSSVDTIGIGVKTPANGAVPYGDDTNIRGFAYAYASDAGNGYISKSIDFYAGSSNTNCRFVIVVYNTGTTDYAAVELYIDNVVLAEKTAITYSGADATDLPATAYANQTYEEVLGDAAGDWYLDEEYTTAASGIINSDAVTLYAKAEPVEPSYGVATPALAGLFIAGQDESTNAGITGGTTGSAVYEVSGTKYAAFRVFGTYVAPAKADGSGADYGKVVLDANGNTAAIESRHVILGYNNNAPTVTDNYAMSTATANLENCWTTSEPNADGSYTVTYSLLLKDIPEAYVGTAFTVRSAVVTADETIYSAEVQENVSAQGIYEKATQDGYTIGWFE